MRGWRIGGGWGWSAAVLIAVFGAPPISPLAAQDRIEAEELVVTARRRAERLGEVPVSVTLLDEGQLQRLGARTLDDAARSVPNLVIPPSGVLGVGQPTIRGLFSAVGTATVGLYVDDTPIQIRPLLFTGSPNPFLFDLERIEVLRGPQGTLFGASSLGGTIRLITRRPDLDMLSGAAGAELSATRDGGANVQASVVGGGPIVQGRVGFRTGLLYRRDSGYVDRVDAGTGQIVRADIDDRSTLALRAAIRARLGERVTLTPSYNFQRRRRADLPFFESSRGPQRQAFLVDQPGRDDLHLASLSVEAKLGSAVLTAVSSFYHREDRGFSDYSPVFGELVLGGAVPGLRPDGGTRNFTRVRQRDWTQELRLASGDPEARLTWVTGLLYRRSGIRLLQEVAEPGIARLVEQFIGASVEEVFGTPLLPGGISYRGTERALETELAAFGEINWRISAALAAFGGARVARSELDLTVASEGPYSGPDSAANRISERRGETPVTPRFGLTWRPAGDALVYASASRGFRAGGANTPVPAAPCGEDLAALGRETAPASYGSDTVWSYELGAKAGLFRHRANLRAALFQVDWKGVQQQIFLPNCGFSYVDNLGTARSRGFEIEAELRPLANLLLTAAIGHADARFRRSLFGARPAGGDTPALLVARGDRVPFAPAWTASGAAEYGWSLGRARRAFLRGDVQYSGAYRRAPAAPAIGFNPAVFAGESHANTQLRVGIEDAAWSASLFADNLFDDRSVLFSNGDLVPVSGTPLRQTTLRPRTIGIDARLSF